ncbi:MAG: tetratricopeptide repeat protein [Planctomycetota bacterium]|nr:MAG: tetratricopeptide repeat protein [Planctomycetota bacterium]
MAFRITSAVMLGLPTVTLGDVNRRRWSTGSTTAIIAFVPRVRLPRRGQRRLCDSTRLHYPQDRSVLRRWLLPRWFRQTDRGLLAVVASATVARLAYWLLLQKSRLAGLQRVDQSYYREWAERIAAGDWLGSEVFEQGPLYAYLVGGLFRLVGPRDEIVLILQLLGGVATCGLVYACSWRLFDRATAVVAGLIAAVYGPFLFYDLMLMKSFLSPLLTMMALWAALRYADALQLRWMAVCGLAIGLATLVRENHLLLLLPMLVWIATRPTAAPLSRRHQLAAAVVLGLSFATIVLPVTWRNWAVGKELVLVTAGGGEAFYMAQGPYAAAVYNPPPFITAKSGREHEDFRIEARRRTGRDLTRGESSRYWFGEGLAAVADDPLRALQLTWAKLLVLLRDEEIPDNQSYAVTRGEVPLLYAVPSFGWIVGLGCAGLILACGDVRRYQLLLGMTLMHVLSVILFYNFGRFRLGLMPLWILLAASAATFIWNRFRSGKWRTAEPAVVLVVVALVMSVLAFVGPSAAPTLAKESVDFDLAVRAGDLDRAEEILREQLGRLTNAAETEDRAATDAANRDGAEPVAGERQEIDPQARKEATLRFQLAKLLLARGRGTLAKREAEAARQLVPSDFEPPLWLGRLLLSEGQLDAAAENFSRAIEANPRAAGAHAGLAQARRRQGRAAEATESFRRALDIRPDLVEVRCDLADLLVAEGQVAEAIEQYEETLRQQPDFERARRQLAKAQAALTPSP